MTKIEVLRQRLYRAIEDGNLQVILEISQKLDGEIVDFMRNTRINKKRNLKENLYIEVPLH
ncbi:aspartyl-phosphate phosphatase Spo0E family protein [Cellulosilyticum sp. I15G10I2]|uniref:aspartyl-phosphate phosphatase Spo0E family protein n=1 Tax=Cellulosilyticum sp. I15G10I2 TaxID=1892843 RepID=UPI00085C8A11|nr:aspartyl-phosphate phosphatase Spo0E family protein [Cellulosilyticum sp. I15G10I2]